MIIAFIASITLLPALFAVLKPPGERLPIGFAALAPVDRSVSTGPDGPPTAKAITAQSCWPSREPAR